MTNNNKRGVTLLLAVLFLTAALSISLGIFYIVFVQLHINRAARESHKAFYAANIARECVIYYRNYIGNISEYGFWDMAHPCNDPDGDGSECMSPTAPNAIPVCRDEQVYTTTSMRLTPESPIHGIEYDAPALGDAALRIVPNIDGPEHIFKFSIKKDDTCADVTVIAKRRRVSSVPITRIVTIADGYSSCNTKTSVNRSFRECISSNTLDSCQ